jgi:hypothetical protein
VTLIPDLERQLTDVAMRGSRGWLRRTLAGGAIAAALLAGLLVATLGDSNAPKRATATPAVELGVAVPESEVPPLREVISVFRRKPTPRDDYGISIGELEATGDRQPGEDTTRSRRIDLPSGPVYLWPKKDGVCASWGNCLGIDTLLEIGGVAIGTSFSSGPGGRREVSGIVVDGIEEVRLTRPGADDIVIPVTQNVFHIDVSDVHPAPTDAHWRDASGKEHVFGPELFPGTPDAG